MQLIIDLPDEWKTRIEYNRRPNTIECGELVESIWRGKILPKNHGKLIDVDAVKARMIPLDFSVQKWISEVDLDIYIPTIVEADKG